MTVEAQAAVGSIVSALISLPLILTYYMVVERALGKGASRLFIYSSFPATDSRYWTSRGYLLGGIIVNLAFLCLSSALYAAARGSWWGMGPFYAVFLAAAITTLIPPHLILAREWKGLYKEASLARAGGHSSAPGRRFNKFRVVVASLLTFLLFVPGTLLLTVVSLCLVGAASWLLWGAATETSPFLVVPMTGTVVVNFVFYHLIEERAKLRQSNLKSIRARFTELHDQITQFDPDKCPELLRLGEERLKCAEEMFLPSDPRLADPLSLLADAHMMQEPVMYAEAVALEKRAISILERALGAEDVDVAVASNNLAWKHQVQGSYSEALVLHNRALGIHEKVFGPRHPHVARNLVCISLVHTKQGDYDAAEPVLVRALSIMEKYSSRHPDIIPFLSRLANVRWELGRHADATFLYKRILEIREKTLGPEHPEVVNDLLQVAGAFDTLENHSEVELSLKRALSIMEKSLPAEDPGLVPYLHNLARFYWKQRRHFEAELSLQRALSIKEKNSPAEDPGLISFLQNLSRVYWMQQKFSEAEILLQRALQIIDALRAPQVLVQNASDDTLREEVTLLTDLAGVYADQGREPESQFVLERLRHVQERAAVDASTRRPC